MSILPILSFSDKVDHKMETHYSPCPHQSSHIPDTIYYVKFMQKIGFQTFDRNYEQCIRDKKKLSF